MRLMALELTIPDHSHRSRRVRPLVIQIPRQARAGSIPVVVDATGLTVFGDGEWTVRQHGAGKRRSWLTVHLAVDANAKDVMGVAAPSHAGGAAPRQRGGLGRGSPPHTHIGRVPGDRAVTVEDRHGRPPSAPRRKRHVSHQAALRGGGASRLFDAQVNAIHARIAAMKRMTSLEMLVSVRVGAAVS